MALESGCSHDEALDAIEMFAKAIRGRCGKVEDERYLFELIAQGGGFDRTDSRIGAWKKRAFEKLLASQGRASTPKKETALIADDARKEELAGSTPDSEAT